MIVSRDDDPNEHPARRAGRLSRTYVAQRRREDWLNLWAENGIIRDPLGKSWMDPEGVGFSTPEARAKWWDDHAPVECYYTVIASFAVANSVANYYSIIVVGERDGDNFTVGGIGGEKFSIKIEGVWTYSVDEEGKLTSMCGYWEEGTANANMTELTGHKYYVE